jgi:hypothetical protein
MGLAGRAADGERGVQRALNELDGRHDPLVERIEALEAELVIEAVAAVSFATGWSNIGGAYMTAGYYLDRERVFLRGAVQYGGGGTGLIFTLPAGYRPSGTLNVPVAIFGATGVLTIASSGTVTDGTFSAASQAFLSLNGVSFRV